MIAVITLTEEGPFSLYVFLNIVLVASLLHRRGRGELGDMAILTARLTVAPTRGKAGYLGPDSQESNSFPALTIKLLAYQSIMATSSSSRTSGSSGLSPKISLHRP